MPKFVCTKRCFHGLRLYRLGDYGKFTKASDGPQNHDGKLIHFEKLEDAKKQEPTRKKRAKRVSQATHAKAAVKVNGEEV